MLPSISCMRACSQLLGLKAKDGKAAGDDTLLADLALKPGTKVMMMG